MFGLVDDVEMWNCSVIFVVGDVVFVVVEDVLMFVKGYVFEW